MTPTVSHSRGRGPAAVTPHALATRAAIEIMTAGGNAVDGAIAANAVLGVVLPTTCGIGGDLFALVHTAGAAAPATLNASGRGGSGLDADAMAAAGLEAIPLDGRESVSVPGCVDGWEALVERFGSRSLAELLEPAIRLAHDGFEASVELSASLIRLRERISNQASAPTLYPDGAAPEPGRIISRPLLARTLESIALDGRAAFYEGRVADAIEQATDGVVTRSDLDQNRPDWVEPIGIDLFGTTAWTVPPNSQGYLTLAAAWLFEQLGAVREPTDPAFHHAAIECYRAVAWERDELVADPLHAPVPPEQLLDPDRLAGKLERLRTGRSESWPAPTPMEGGTAYFCTSDTDGMGISMIQSNFHGIGAGISASDTGVWLHNRGAGFTLTPGHPNRAGPGKRPLHTLAPTLWSDSGRLRLLLGTRGGHQQPQYLLQAVALLFHAGWDPVAAQAAPRWNMDHAGAGTSSHVQMEDRTSTAVVSGLEQRGHTVERVPDYPAGWGPVSIIAATDDGLTAAADPRVTTAAAEVC